MRPRGAKRLALAISSNNERIIGTVMMYPAAFQSKPSSAASLGPNHPCRKDTVEQGLDESGAEKVLALLALELDSERRLERGSYRGKAGAIISLHLRERVTRIRREEPRDVVWSSEWCPRSA